MTDRASTSLARAQTNLVRWFTDETYCSIQRHEGWYRKDCLESGAAKSKRCTRCRWIAKLIDELSGK